MPHGTWKTTGDHPAGGLAFLAVLAAVLLGSGAAAAVASAIFTAVIVAGAVVMVAVIGGTVLVVYRIRHPQAAAAIAERAALVRAEQARPALEQRGPQHVHYHLHGMDEQTVRRTVGR